MEKIRKMVLCKVNIENVTKEDQEIIKSFYFTPLETPEISEDNTVVLNFMGGTKCKGTNEHGDKCIECRFQPEIVLRYLRKQKEIKIG